jgi:hypothetical protein
MQIQREVRERKLRLLCEAEGFDSIDAMLEATVFESVSPGICVTPDCNGTIEVEPDQDRGWCPVCGGNTVASALILAGII